MKSLSLEEENITKDLRNLFRLKQELNETAINNVRNLLRLEKESKSIKDKIFRDINNPLEHEQEK